MPEEQAVSDTPETDAFASQPADCAIGDTRAFVKLWVEYAQKLERERNQNRAEFRRTFERETVLRNRVHIASVALDALYTMLAKAVPEDAPLQPSIAWLTGQLRGVLTGGVPPSGPAPAVPELDTADIARDAVRRLLFHGCPHCVEWACHHRDLLLVHDALTRE